MSAGISLHGSTRAAFEAAETAHETRLLDQYVDEYGDGPDIDPTEEAALAYLDERWGGEAA
jgi:hypothetical protein